MKSLRFLSAIVRLLLFTAVVCTASGLPPVPVALALTLISLVPLPKGVALTAINVTSINTTLGAYLREYADVLVTEMLLNQNFEDRVEIWDDCTDEVPLPSLTISDLVKPGNVTAFAPAGNELTFKARNLKVRDAKVDLLLYPAQLHKTWLGMYRKKGKGDDVMDLPFEAFIMQYIIQKVKENVHLLALYKGSYNAAGTTPGATMNGFLTIIANEITATNITPITTGVITSANVSSKLFLVYDGLGEAYKSNETQMLVSPTIFDWYVRQFNPLTNATIVATDTAGLDKTPKLNRVGLHGTNCVVVREPGLAGSQRIITTPKANMVFGTDSISDMAEIRVQEFERSLKLMMDFRIGAEFKEIHSRALAVNEQA